MSGKHGAPKHQNKYAWKPKAGHKINETEVGGKFRPYSEITGVCPRCKEQIDWKRRYGKYKPLAEPAKCQQCSKRGVRQAYHNLCPGCAKEQNVCAKCRCRVNRIVGRDSSEVEAEQKSLDEAIKNARERDRRTLLRAVQNFFLISSGVRASLRAPRLIPRDPEVNGQMNRDESKSSAKMATSKENKVGELFPSASLEEYAELRRDDNGDEDDNEDEDLILS